MIAQSFVPAYESNSYQLGCGCLAQWLLCSCSGGDTAAALLQLGCGCQESGSLVAAWQLGGLVAEALRWVGHSVAAWGLWLDGGGSLV